MAKSKSRPTAEINSGSMADIAFLLLIFFLVTTTIASDKGLPMTLPRKQENNEPIEINARNLFKVLVNSRNQLLVDEEPMPLEQLRESVIRFVSNNGVDPKSSESPKEAIVSIKTDRGTDYGVYVSVLDAIKAAYHELRAKHLGISVKEYLALDPDEPSDKEKLELAKQAFPANISEADPTDSQK
jgi:biopolymer transport protein ExbD